MEKAVRHVTDALRDDSDAYINKIEDGLFIVGGRVEVQTLGAGIIEVTDLHSLKSVTTRSTKVSVEQIRTYLKHASNIDLRDEHDPEIPVHPVLDDGHLRTE